MAVMLQNLPGFAGIGTRKTVFLCRASGRKTGAAKGLWKNDFTRFFVRENA